MQCLVDFIETPGDRLPGRLSSNPIQNAAMSFMVSRSWLRQRMECNRSFRFFPFSLLDPAKKQAAILQEMAACADAGCQIAALEIEPQN